MPSQSLIGRCFLALIAFLIVFALASPGAFASEPAKWRLDVDENGVKVYTRDTSESDVKAYKAVTQIKGTAEQLVGLLNDLEKMPEWVAGLSDVETLKKLGGSEELRYHVIKTPWPIPNQDAVVHTKWSRDGKSGAITQTLVGEPKYSAEKSGLLRQQHYRGSWTLKPMDNGMVEVSYMGEVHPGVKNVRPWMHRLMSYDRPYKTLRNLQSLDLAPYQNHTLVVNGDVSEGMAVAR